MYKYKRGATVELEDGRLKTIFFDSLCSDDYINKCISKKYGIPYHKIIIHDYTIKLKS